MLPRPPLRLDLLVQCSATQLRALWPQWFDTPPPGHVRQALLVRALAHRMQEHEYGGLSATVRQHLQGLGEVRKKTGLAGQSARRLAPGTHVIREWGNAKHQVTVERHGFVYRGQRYRSLSEIARTITGTRWSGPAFFGLKSTRQASGREVAK